MVSAQGTLRVALHLSSVNKHREECSKGHNKKARKEEEKKESALSDSLQVLAKHLQCVNCRKEDMTNSQGLFSPTLFCVQNTYPGVL